MTLSDEEARRRGTQKTVLERKARPTFDNLVEIQHRDRLAIYRDMATVVDRYLAGISFRPEVRVRGANGQVQIRENPLDQEGSECAETEGHDEERATRSVSVRIYLIGVSRSRIEKVIRELGIPVRVVEQPSHADLILSLKAQQKRQPKKLQKALDEGVEFYTVKSNTLTQIKNFLCGHFANLLGQQGRSRDLTFAVQQAEDAIVRVQRSLELVELSPQNAYTRRLQHELIQTHGLHSESLGRSPFRRVVAYPGEI